MQGMIPSILCYMSPSIKFLGRTTPQFSNHGPTTPTVFKPGPTAAPVFKKDFMTLLSDFIILHCNRLILYRMYICWHERDRNKLWEHRLPTFVLGRETSRQIAHAN